MVRQSRSHGSAHRKQRGALAVGPVLLVAGGVIAALVTAALVTLRLETSVPVADHPSSTTSTALLPRPRGPTPRAEQQIDPYWFGVLTALDARRSRAWRLDRPDLLAGVYAPGSAAMRVDRTNLERYIHRGLRVTRARMQFSSVVLKHRATRYVSLLVVDRLRPATAVTTEGDLEPLPRDQATRHRIGLRRVGHRWQIATVALASSRSAG